MYVLSIRKKDAPAEEAGDGLIYFDDSLVEAKDLEDFARDLNDIHVYPSHEEDGVPVLKNKRTAQVIGGKLYVVDWSSITPNPIEITGPGKIEDVFGKIKSELEEVEVIQEGFEFVISQED